MSKHTPGPWSAHPHMDGKSDFSGHITDCSNHSEPFMAHTVYVGAGEILIAEASAYKSISTAVVRGYPRVEDFEENKANARLIAAAPDLLAALKYLLDNQGDYSSDGIALCRAAIAKAEGK